MTDGKGISDAVPSCVHRCQSDEAYILRAGSNATERTRVWLCGWPEAHPEHFVDAPRWLQKAVYPGLAIVPETDCVRCPGRASPPSDVSNPNRTG